MIESFHDSFKIIKTKFRDCELQIEEISLTHICVKLIKFLAINFLFGNSKKYEIYTLSYSQKDSIRPRFNVGYLDRYRLKISLLLSLVIFTIKILYNYKNIENRSLLVPLLKGYYMSQFIEEINNNKIEFWGYSFTLEVTALLNFLRLKGFYIKTYENVNFVERLNYIYSNEIIHNSFIQSQYSASLDNEYGKIIHSHFIGYDDLKNIFKHTSPYIEARIIVYYCSGANQRKKIGSIYKANYLEQLWAAEIINLTLLEQFSINNPGYEIIVMPHYARNIETEKSALSEYKHFINGPNMRIGKIHEVDEVSNKANLTLSVKSNTFWDSILSGRKSLLMNPFPLDDFLLSSQMKKFIFTPTISQLGMASEIIFENCNMNNFEFFNSKFLQKSYEQN